MGFWGWFWLIVVVVVGLGILMAWADSEKAKAQGNALAAIPDFQPTVIFKGMFGSAGLALDPTHNKFAISHGPHNTKVFNFSDLVGVEVLRNGSSVHRTNRGSQVAGAAVGAVLLGPVGLLLGGLTGSKRSIEKVDRLSLKIFTNDLVNPTHEIVFLNAPGSKPDSMAVKLASQELDNWHGRFQTILAMSNRVGKSG
ncbi:UNVERIFIED_ORG: hypothetical protein GGI66_002600 [Rhizobium esperanzae]|uniref:hypothetical protein n=1 Tax=Rhizobium phaseoli TaxID=396 RepID=UPI000F88E5C6|nr:hypothetical protein [Rhizobium phaseoli]